MPHASPSSYSSRPLPVTGLSRARASSRGFTAIRSHCSAFRPGNSWAEFLVRCWSETRPPPGREICTRAEGRYGAASRTPRQGRLVRHGISDAQSEGEILYAGGMAREITPWTNAEQELRHTVLGALKAQEFERAMVCEIPARFRRAEPDRARTAIGFDPHGPGEVSPETCARAIEVQKHLGEMMESVREYSYELNPSTVERAGLRPALDRMASRNRARFPAFAARQRGPVSEDRSQAGKRDVPDCAGSGGKRGSTFRLLHNRNRGKVHTYRYCYRSA